MFSGTLIRIFKKCLNGRLFYLGHFFKTKYIVFIFIKLIQFSSRGYCKSSGNTWN